MRNLVIDRGTISKLSQNTKEGQLWLDLLNYTTYRKNCGLQKEKNTDIEKVTETMSNLIVSKQKELFLFLTGKKNNSCKYRSMSDVTYFDYI